MRHLVVLPGNSLRNRDWGIACANYFGPKFDSVYMQEYDHWQTGERDNDVERELTKLEAAVADLDDEIYVLAKSIGSLLILLAVHRGFLKPEKCVFFGMPLELASKQLFKDDWSPLSTFSIPTIAYHNDEDPISYSFTSQALAEQGARSIRLITLKGDNHDYLDFKEYELEITDFLKV